MWTIDVYKKSAKKTQIGINCIMLPQNDIFSVSSIHKALKNWRNLVFLGEHPLCNLHLTETRHQQMKRKNIPMEHALSLQDVIGEAIEALRPDNGAPDNRKKEWRSYLILHEEFIRGKSPDYVKDVLEISTMRTYQHSRKQALQKLSSIIRQQEDTIAKMDVANNENTTHQSKEHSKLPNSSVKAKYARDWRTAKLYNLLYKEETKDRKKKLALIKKVRLFWVNGVLESAMMHMAHLDLDKQHFPGMISRPWDMILEIPDQIPSLLPPNKPIVEVYEAVGPTMLILGPPGSGKTVSLLELARDIVTHAEQDDLAPIPVVLNLSTWSQHQGKLDEWIIDELLGKYNVPQRDSRKWLINNELLLLLDGFDEVDTNYRRECAEKINEFRKNYGFTKMVVCSRAQEYEYLDMRFNFDGAIILRPLTDSQITRYLAEKGEELQGIRDMILNNVDFRELARSPLMLNIMTLAYRGISIEDLEKIASIEEHQKHLFDVYIDHMLRRRGINPRYTFSDTRNWLIQIANTMYRTTQSVLFIEHIQSDWLLGKRYDYGLGFIVGLIVFMLIGLPIYIGLLLALNEIMPDSIISVLIGLSGSITAASIVWFAENKMFGLIGSATVGFMGGLSIILVSWALTGHILVSLLIGGGIGLAIGITFGTIGGSAQNLENKRTGQRSDRVQVVERLDWSWKDGIVAAIKTVPVGFVVGSVISWIANPILGNDAGIAAGIASASIGISAIGLARGFKGSELEIKIEPNQGIHNSLRNAMKVGIIGGSILAIFTCLPSIMAFGINTGLAIALALGTGGCMAGGLYRGGISVIRHYLLRLMLYKIGSIPLDLESFLEYAVDRILMFRVGGGYIFIHRLLLEYLALRMK